MENQPIFMNDTALNMSASFIQSGLSASSDLSCKSRIHSSCYTFISKTLFPSMSPWLLLTILATDYLQITNLSASRVLLQVWSGAPKFCHCFLKKDKSKATHLISNPHLTNSLQSLSHCYLASDISIFIDTSMKIGLWKYGLLFL